MSNAVVFIPVEKGKVTVIDFEQYEKVRGCWFELNNRGYVRAVRKENRRRRRSFLHRLVTDAPPGTDVDHIDHDLLNNVASNLRVGSTTENMMNLRKRASHRNKPTSSRFKGVYWHGQTNKWASEIHLRGKKTYLGLFHTEQEAAQAYNAAAIRLFGDKAMLNQVSA